MNLERFAKFIESLSLNYTEDDVMLRVYERKLKKQS